MLCDWLCINQYCNGTYCLELQDQAVMETLSDLQDEYTMLLHYIGTVHPVTWSHPKSTESCCVLSELWHDTSSSFTVLRPWECSVTTISFVSQRLLCLERCSYLDSQQLTPNCYHSSSLSSYMVLQGCIAQGYVGWWEGLCSNGFQHSDMKTVAVSNELHTEYLLSTVLHNAKLPLNIAMLKLF